MMREEQPLFCHLVLTSDASVFFFTVCSSYFRRFFFFFCFNVSVELEHGCCVFAAVMHVFWCLDCKNEEFENGKL